MTAAVITAIAAALGLSAVLGVLHSRRSGVLRETVGESAVSIDGLELSVAGPTIVHFSAPWCGPCVAVRRVVDQVCAEVPGVAHLEVDLDTNPEVARELSVLSLPTTFIFDADRRQRYRTHGVPTAAVLRSALEPLLA